MTTIDETKGNTGFIVEQRTPNGWSRVHGVGFASLYSATEFAKVNSKTFYRNERVLGVVFTSDKGSDNDYMPEYFYGEFDKHGEQVFHGPIYGVS